MARRTPLIRDHATAVLVGLALIAAGGWILHETYEGRGKDRPYLIKVLGGGWA